MHWESGNVLECVADHGVYYGWELAVKKGDRMRYEMDYDTNWAYGTLVDLQGNSLVDSDTAKLKSGYFLKCLFKRIGEVVDEKIIKARTKVIHDKEYFQAYSCVWIHWLMLSDRPRTLTYQNAINNAAKFIQGKIVLDIGCGTGILSMFCAKAGAKHVYAVDASNFTHEAKMIIKENNLSDRITVIKGCLEDKNLPIPKKSVDVIVSEWMGHFLICEAMIATVLIGRDRYLKPDGLMMPSSAVLYLAPISLENVFKKKVDFLDNLGGVNLSLLKADAINAVKKEYLVNHIEAENVIADAAVVFEMDMYTAQVKDLENWEKEFDFVLNADDTWTGFSAWFDNGFAKAPPRKYSFDGKHQQEEERDLILSTSPFVEKTHWMQANFVFDQRVSLLKGDHIIGKISVSRENLWDRQFKIHISCSIPSKKFTGQDTFYI